MDSNSIVGIPLDVDNTSGVNWRYYGESQSNRREMVRIELYVSFRDHLRSIALRIALRSPVALQAHCLQVLESAMRLVENAYATVSYIGLENIFRVNWNYRGSFVSIISRMFDRLPSLVLNALRRMLTMELDLSFHHSLLNAIPRRIHSPSFLFVRFIYSCSELNITYAVNWSRYGEFEEIMRNILRTEGELNSLDNLGSIIQSRRIHTEASLFISYPEMLELTIRMSGDQYFINSIIELYTVYVGVFEAVRCSMFTIEWGQTFLDNLWIITVRRSLHSSSRLFLPCLEGLDSAMRMIEVTCYTDSYIGLENVQSIHWMHHEGLEAIRINMLRMETHDSMWNFTLRSTIHSQRLIIRNTLNFRWRLQSIVLKKIVYSPDSLYNYCLVKLELMMRMVENPPFDDVYDHLGNIDSPNWRNVRESEVIGGGSQSSSNSPLNVIPRMNLQCPADGFCEMHYFIFEVDIHTVIWRQGEQSVEIRGEMMITEINMNSHDIQRGAPIRRMWFFQVSMLINSPRELEMLIRLAEYCSGLNVPYKMMFLKLCMTVRIGTSFYHLSILSYRAFVLGDPTTKNIMMKIIMLEFPLYFNPRIRPRNLFLSLARPRVIAVLRVEASERIFLVSIGTGFVAMYRAVPIDHMGSRRWVPLPNSTITLFRRRSYRAIRN